MVQIPQHELRFDYARSGGKGGQNVNKVESKVILHWSVAASQAVTDEQKQRIRQVLANRLNSDDAIVVTVQDERDQIQNKAIALARLQELVTAAIRVPKKRKPTKPTRAAREERLQTKYLRARVKRSRTSVQIDE